MAHQLTASHQMKRLFESLSQLTETAGTRLGFGRQTAQISPPSDVATPTIDDEVSRCQSEAPSTSSEIPAVPERDKKTAKRRRKTVDSKQKHKRPAELIQTHYVTQMKVNESAEFDATQALLVLDSWRNEWNRGVQVPVCPEQLPAPFFQELQPAHKSSGSGFKMSKKFISLHRTFGDGALQNKIKISDECCNYDLDDLDLRWLSLVNESRARLSNVPIGVGTMECVMERLELMCAEGLRSQANIGIEYDEDTVCDVCMSPYCDESNEMVFCDGCDTCVHQACYGIPRIPEAAWLCRVCSIGVKNPSCVLCPNKGGAMKSTRSGQRWAHVSCALWIPEIGFGDAELMEPITNIASVPERRWFLRCSICRERDGACVQCCYRNCSVAYHVTCAQRNNYDIKVICDESLKPELQQDMGSDDEDDNVRMVSYCPKHGRRGRSSVSPKKFVSHEHREEARKARHREQLDYFFEYVNPKTVTDALKVENEVVSTIYEYWKLKRKAQFNEPLLQLQHKHDHEENLGASVLARRIQMLIYLRQNLEKARNLCYLVSRRERLKRTWVEQLAETFGLQRSMMQSTRVSGESSRGSSQEAAHIGLSKRDVSLIQRAFSDPASFTSLYDDLLRLDVNALQTNMQSNPQISARMPTSSHAHQATLKQSDSTNSLASLIPASARTTCSSTAIERLKNQKITPFTSRAESLREQKAEQNLFDNLSRKRPADVLEQ